ncbi:MAG: DUF3048 domain-containing protein [Acidimicrobiia bacterium]|nr:DUF3048 domain-containing protein [Acidimicrobiia bacterium]
MVDEQSPSGGSGFSGLIETVKKRPVLFGGLGVLVLAAIVAIVVVAMGGGSDDEPGDDVAADATTSTTAGAPAVAPPTGGATAQDTLPGDDDTPAPALEVDRNPLTGAPLSAASADRVVAVKVDNAPEAGPAIGIQDAELIIEAPVEGGLTRLTAMFFENEPTVIGPIRSVRPIDADLLSPWRPFLVTTGGQSFVYREILAAGVEILDEGTDGLFQQIERRQPYHLVATIPLIEAEAGQGAPPVAALPFGDEELGGTAAASVAIPFSGVADVVWEYDSATDQYARIVNGEPYQIFPEYDAELTDFGTDTVIVMKAAQRSAGYTDAAGMDVPTFDVIGFGDVLVFHGGEVRTGQWLRAAQSDGWFFLDDSGAQFTIPIGSVWLEIVPRFVDVTVR